MVENECVLKWGQVKGVDYTPRVDMSVMKLKVLCGKRIDLYDECIKVSNDKSVEFNFWIDLSDLKLSKDITLKGEYAFLLCGVSVKGASVVSPAMSYYIADSDWICERVEYNYDTISNCLYISIPVEMCYTLVNASAVKRSEILADMFKYRTRVMKFVSYMHL